MSALRNVKKQLHIIHKKFKEALFMFTTSYDSRLKAYNGLFYLFVFIAFTTILSSSALAHSIYIQSSRYFVTEGKSSPLFFCYGHHIPVDDGIRSKKLKYIKIFEPTGDVKQLQIRDETCLHSYMVSYDHPGTYVLAAETNPGYYTVYIDKKGRERHTIKPKNAIMDKAQSIKKSLYSTQHTKTYIVCKEPSQNFPYKIGQKLELVPTRDISTIKPGENLELEVYYNGKKYEGKGTWDATYNGFSTESEDLFYQATEVTGGNIVMPVTRPGRWFVRYYFKTEATGEDKEKYTQMKYTATLVFQVPNEKKTKREQVH